MERYERNNPTISSEEAEVLMQSKVCVVGCGGLGGYIIEMLARIGVGYITAIDGDSFTLSNLNRQILSDEYNLGLNKAKVAKERVKKINATINVQAIPNMMTEKNAVDLVGGYNVIIDALDNIQSRLLLEETCKKNNCILIHGAIGGWRGQVTTIYPGDDTLKKIYYTEDLMVKLGNPSFTPAIIAGIQVAETIKVILRKKDILRKKILYIDTLTYEIYILDI